MKSLWAFIEDILHDLVNRRAQARRDAHDAAAVSQHAAQLNAEMSDMLAYQADLEDIHRSKQIGSN